MRFARRAGVETAVLSGATCVNRLCELGFTLVRRASGMALLRRGERRVIVPDVTIEPDMLRAILRSADVSETEFFRRVQRSGAYARSKIGEAQEPDAKRSTPKR
jgi:predicted RNA binding protein YcfA (HicA-like mRNA interferase family)